MTSGILVPAAATITATSAIATAASAFGMYRAVKRHERALYGAQGIEEWDGLVPTVSEHEDVLEEEGLK